MSNLSENAKKNRNAYYRLWRAKNKDKVKQYNEAYWARKTECFEAAKTDRRKGESV